MLDNPLGDGVPYLVDVGDENPARIFGWYYGYPPCCVEAFIAEIQRWLNEGAPCYQRWPAEIGAEEEGPGRHPVSGHILCKQCAAGPMAPLPARLAERYGFATWNEGDDAPVFEKPTRRTAHQTERDEEAQPR